MRKGIHPELKLINVKCACGAEHKIWSTVETMRIDVCSNCHPFYKGGKGMQFVDSEGRIDRFRRKYGDNY